MEERGGNKLNIKVVLYNNKKKMRDVRYKALNYEIFISTVILKRPKQGAKNNHLSAETVQQVVGFLNYLRPLLSDVVSHALASSDDEVSDRRRVRGGEGECKGCPVQETSL